MNQMRDTRKRIALVAHDAKKADILAWARYNRGILAGHELVATGTTGRLLSEDLDLSIECLLSGPLGGDQQVGAMIADGRIDLVVFFCDPLTAQPHEPDVQALIRLAGVWNVPIAINRATADLAIASPLFYDRAYMPETPDYRQHEQRPVPAGA
ncbi:MAG TPA: methylglyoxal synthase [Actinomycetota bacterium]|nr:methylglyoxal synthase [Actinomycetota bacterium]